MRQGANLKRQRGRPNGRRPQFGQNQTFESNGPDVKIRGNASQVLEKYQTLARDALVSGDRVAAENYFQHAEHYHRIINAAALNAAEGRQAGNRPQGDGRGRGGPRGEARGGTPEQANGSERSETETETAGEPDSDAEPATT